MFKLIRVDNESFILVAGKRAIHSNRAGIIRVLLEIDVDVDEIEAGLSHLINRGDHVAEYGVNKTFMYSTRLAA